LRLFADHPNVRLFISRSGPLGGIETVLSGVPILGRPVIGDQKMNCESLKEYGTAICMKFGSITKEALLLEMNNILTNAR
jgi:glucuronosyltransferase